MGCIGAVENRGGLYGFADGAAKTVGGFCRADVVIGPYGVLRMRQGAGHTGFGAGKTRPVGLAQTSMEDRSAARSASTDSMTAGMLSSQALSRVSATP